MKDIINLKHLKDMEEFLLKGLEDTQLGTEQWRESARNFIKIRSEQYIQERKDEYDSTWGKRT